MRSLLSLILSLLILMPPTTSQASPKDATCENGECVEKIVDRLEDLSALYNESCLPPSNVNQQEYYEEKGITEECWKIVTEINHLEDKLQKHQNRLEAKLGCQSGDCNLPNQEESLNAQLADLSKVEQNLSCTEPKKQQVRASCGQDLTCVLAASALGIGGFVAEYMLPEKAKPKGCHLGNDSCATQLATGFLKAVVSFFEGAWDLLKTAGKYAGKKMKEFWNWVSGAEDHSSTSQLALAKASKDDGVFKMLIKDFPGTMKNIWQALVGSLKEWLKTDIFCQKWEGVPRFSKCLEPAVSYDCISCKSMVTGLCAVSGTLLAEIVPSFLTGGLLTAAKYGVNGAVKIAKGFRVSGKGLAAIKASRVAKMALQASTKVDDVLRLSKGLKAAKIAVQAALRVTSRYLLSPARKAVKVSFQALTKVAKNGTMYVMQSKAGKVLVFSGKALKKTGEIIIYPVENPMTAWAFKAGERSFEKVFKLGAPKLTAKSAVVATIVDNQKNLDNILARLDEARIKSPRSIAAVEDELVKAITPRRSELTQIVLKNSDGELNQVIKNLYPELQYGDLAKKLPPAKVLEAEEQLLRSIGEMSDSPVKTKLLRDFEAHRSSIARSKVVKLTPTYERQVVFQNASLADDARVTKAFETAGIDASKLTPEVRKDMSLTILKAHNQGDGIVYKYSFSDLKEKTKILRQGGFTPEQADNIIRSGLAGKLRPEDTFAKLSAVSVDDIDPSDFKLMIESDDYASLFSKLDEADQPKLAKALKHLENTGLTPEDSAKIYKKYKKQFDYVMKSSDQKSDAASYLAEIIRKEQKAGLADDLILDKLDEAFKGCK